MCCSLSGLIFAEMHPRRAAQNSMERFPEMVDRAGKRTCASTLLQTARICQCCHPSVTIDAKGALHVMWRNASERLARSLLHFLGRWRKDICVSPETGPMVRGLSMPAQWMAEK